MTKLKLTDSEVLKIIQHAKAEAIRFTDAYLEQYASDAFSCGFAWVNIKPANGQFARMLKSIGVGHIDGNSGGWIIWNPSGHPTQNMCAKEAGAEAFAAELSKFGVNAYAASRID